MDLGARAASAFRWAASATLLSQLATWMMTIVVIRMLTPDDYGLMAMAMVFVSFLMIVNALGMGAVLAQRATLDDATRANAFGLTLLVNGLFCLP
jgi:teichuronic acid exporter